MPYDALGERWAAEHHITCTVFPAKWDQHGKAAGAIRNLEMATYADALIALPGGVGTANMIMQATKIGLRVYDVGRK